MYAASMINFCRITRALLISSLLLSTAGQVAAASNNATQGLVRLRREAYTITPRSLPIAKLDEQAAETILANGSLAVIDRGESLGLLRRGARAPEPFVALPMHPNIGFDALCLAGESFFVGIHESRPATSPPLAERVRETQPTATGTPLGFYKFSLSNNPQRAGVTEIQFIETLKITAHPQPADMPFAYQGPASLRQAIQSCAWDGQGLYLGMAGALGRTDLERQTIDLIEVDDEATARLNRRPMFLDQDGMWLAYDDGGAGPGWLRSPLRRGKSKRFVIENGEDTVAYSAIVRHRGAIYVGTSHGLFRLDEASASFVFQDLGQGSPGANINQLYSDASGLWVFSGGEWLRLDPKNRSGIRFVTQPHAILVTGAPFDGYWLIGGPDGVWRTPLLLKTDGPAGSGARPATPKGNP